jgi:hypothetical protein
MHILVLLQKVLEEIAAAASVVGNQNFHARRNAQEQGNKPARLNNHVNHGILRSEYP